MRHNIFSYFSWDTELLNCINILMQLVQLNMFTDNLINKVFQKRA